MLVDDPFSYVVNSLISIIYSKVRDICVDIQPNNLVVLVEEPSKKEFGDLSIPLHRLSRICNVSVDDLSETLRNLSLNDVFSKVEMVKGYLNVFINEVNYARVLANTVRMKGQDYGFLKDDKRLNVVVEFVSANPVHPLHIGSGRNAVLGEFLSRIFEVRGHRVQRRYYVNDLGRQVATLVYGYLKLGRPKVPQ
ncbi:MAG: arginine--tRNA ligase, partial [Desulfurococcaceae archaeon]|nr:arginine--tRNA ligase [Desulfurococcaceae archaeon]